MKKIIFFIIAVLVLIGLIIGAKVYIANRNARNQENPSVSSLKDQITVGDYLRQHIAEISPQKAVLGGKFYVTNVTFGDGEGGTVAYEDGHIALKANFTYKLDAGDKITITSFDILPEEEKTVSFNETGNLVKDEGADGWSLVYEKPGQPALRVILETSESSVCQINLGTVPCSTSFQNGDRVQVAGEQSPTKVIVTSLTKI